LSEASRKTRKQVEELLAKRFPRADVASTIRKLPPPRQITTEVMSPSPLKEGASMPAPARENAAPSVTCSPSSSSSSAPALSQPPPPPKPRTVVEPLREDRYRLQLNASAELKRKLELARDLMSHANPTGDLPLVIERALDLLIDKLQRERFAQAKQPRRQAAPNPYNRQVSNATRRAIVERDGLQCSYVSPEGERCPSRQFLQFHHEHAWALGGKSTADNCRILCAQHNQFLAERDFGKQRIARKIANARTEPERPPDP
jgi:5-methylcytosine-specific restriction endonuclease McrA